MHKWRSCHGIELIRHAKLNPIWLMALYDNFGSVPGVTRHSATILLHGRRIGSTILFIIEKHVPTHFLDLSNVKCLQFTR